MIFPVAIYVQIFSSNHRALGTVSEYLQGGQESMAAVHNKTPSSQYSGNARGLHLRLAAFDEL
ncbi:uncharacterized protein Bfra_000462 [Botrytis fragariae]|uniref:Uncharacterized protein n=1 Tax=Botrytis fragariae TaxID=1964551 RepID=A0A8H6EN03_9HELO|nr:uncharacterized protein Bfra_000462 [Botrytis fragariae]KAF5878296.1 hypothetical protein Bfra_000462 [Botrytis fragariae]